MGQWGNSPLSFSFYAAGVEKSLEKILRISVDFFRDSRYSMKVRRLNAHAVRVFVVLFPVCVFRLVL